MGVGSLRFYLGAFATALCGTAAVVACGDSSESAFGAPSSVADGGGSSSSSGGSRSDSGTSDAGTPIAANGIVIVHAASFGAFRLCFEKHDDRRPIPSSDLLPESNLVGVEVGSAVRIDPIVGAPGKVYAFAVEDIDQYYPPGVAGPTCKNLLASPAFGDRHEVGTINDNLSFGVHLLVLRGSVADQNLKLEKITLSAFTRPPQTLPIQVVHLARGLEVRAANRKIGIGAGLVDGGDGGLFLEGALEGGVPVPQMPYELDYDPNDDGAYATSGFLVTLGAPLDAGLDAGDAGKREVILAQSLADIQRMSAPRALPGPWFNAGSNYVMLLLGNAEEKDAQADELERLHFLAVPVAAPPTSDAGEPVGDATTD